MSVEESKALVRRFVEECNKGKAAAMAVMDELYTTDIVFHSSTGKDICGLKDFKKFNGEFFSAIPDAHFTIDDIVAEGNKVVTRWTMAGTHKGELTGNHIARGVRATNRKMKIWAITIHRVAGGKFVEEWERYDTLGAMQQLGLVPTPAKG